jgi:hypothetical protein
MVMRMKSAILSQTFHSRQVVTYVQLLIEAIEESKRDVDADIARAESNRLERQKRALQLVSANLAKLSQAMTTSRRILKHLRTLRRLLLEERQLNKHYADYKQES